MPQFKRQRCRTLVGRAVSVWCDRGCRHHPGTTGLPGLRFLAQHVADRRLRYVVRGRRAESFGLVASCCVVRIETVLRLVGRVCRSRGGFERLVAQRRTIVLQPPPFPVSNYTLRDRPSLLALHHDPLASAGHLIPQRERARCFQPATAACFGRRQLAEIRAAPH